MNQRLSFFIFFSQNIDLSRRKIVQYDDFGDQGDYLFGHGSHTSGTAVGRRAINGKDESKGIADGVAYDAKIAFFDLEVGQSGLKFPTYLDRLLGVGRPYAKIHSARQVLREN